MYRDDFEESLRFGQIGEGVIARWLRVCRGASVLPVYEKQINTGKGPRFYLPQGELIAPDMLVMTAKGVSWMDAKRKRHFTWHDKTRTWQTGIDLRHYGDYLQLADHSPWPVWLLFLHEDDSPERRYPSMPSRCPTGLFGGDLKRLAECEDHRDRFVNDNRQTKPMVYWRVGDLHQFAKLEDALNPRQRARSG